MHPIRRPKQRKQHFPGHPRPPKATFHFRDRDVADNVQRIRCLCDRCNGFKGPLINVDLALGVLAVTYARGIPCRCTATELRLWARGLAR